jgi:type IV pilus assembly protein PilA
MKLKNKKGFTLIELLAVIVVLAIIALIATPIVMNTIKNAKKGAAERSADNYIKQVETAVAEAKLENKSVPNGTYNIDGNGNLTGAGLPDGKLEINMSGNKPTSGTVKISNGGVSQDGTTMTVGDYNVKYNQENKKYEATEKGNTTPDIPSTTVVYRWSTDEIKIGATIDTNNTSKFTKDASTLGKSYYLKHVLDKDNKVTESYVCAIFGGTEYCLRGGNPSFYGYAANEADYTGNMLILKSLRDAKIEGTNCNFSNRDSVGCYVGYFSLHANSDGSVGTNVDVGYCNVHADGSSSCESQ